MLSKHLTRSTLVMIVCLGIAAAFPSAFLAACEDKTVTQDGVVYLISVDEDGNVKSEECYGGGGAETS